MISLNLFELSLSIWYISPCCWRSVVMVFVKNLKMTLARETELNVGSKVWSPVCGGGLYGFISKCLGFGKCDSNIQILGVGGCGMLEGGF